MQFWRFVAAVTVGFARSRSLPRKLVLSRYQVKRSLADLQDDGGHTQGDTATNDDEDPSSGDHEIATTQEKSDSETNIATATGGVVVAAIISFFFAAACLLGRRHAADADEPVVGSPLARAVKGVLERLDALAAEHQRVMRASLSSLSGDVAGALPVKDVSCPEFDEECEEAGRQAPA